MFAKPFHNFGKPFLTVTPPKSVNRTDVIASFDMIHTFLLNELIIKDNESALKADLSQAPEMLRFDRYVVVAMIFIWVFFHHITYEPCG